MTMVIPPSPAIRKKVMDAAEKSVLEVGLRRTTVVGLSRRSDVSRTTIYRHWRDTDHILTDLLTLRLTALATDVPSAPKTVDAFANTVVDFCDRARRDQLLVGLRDTDPQLLAKYLFVRFGASQERLLHHFEPMLCQLRDTHPRITAESVHEIAAMLLIFLQGAVLSAPTVASTLSVDAWKRETALMIKRYLS